MAWIRTIAFGEAAGRLRELYERSEGPGDRVDNILAAHSQSLRRLLHDEDRWQPMHAALVADRPQSAFGSRELAMLRDAGLDDGEILEVNQVTAYFAYANRTVLGLGSTPGT
jgi:uncharacterized protein YciW